MPRRSRRCSGAITAASASTRTATAARRSCRASCSAWIAAALHYLWDREMARGTYRLKQVQVDIPTGKVKARTFAVDRKQVGYAGRLSPEAIARLILQG